MKEKMYRMVLLNVSSSTECSPVERWLMTIGRISIKIEAKEIF